MKAEISYVNGITKTTVENDLSFRDFCIQLFKKKIYLSIVNKEDEDKGVSLAINTENIMFVEELK